jgi:hypothetical protein
MSGCVSLLLSLLVRKLRTGFFRETAECGFSPEGGSGTQFKTRPDAWNKTSWCSAPHTAGASPIPSAPEPLVSATSATGMAASKVQQGKETGVESRCAQVLRRSCNRPVTGNGSHEVIA